MSGSAPIAHALVTGAGGFIGKRLCAALVHEGVRVTALHRNPRSGPWQAQIPVDLARDGPIDVGRDVDTVFHLAGHAHARDSGDSREMHEAVTVAGTERLLGAFGPSVRRIVFFSSVKAMGESTPAQCADESTVARPTSSYGRARLRAEHRVLALHPAMHSVVLRLPLVYGPGVKGNLHRLLVSARRGRGLLLPEYGNRRSMVHVDDVARAGIAAATCPVASGRTYLLSDGETLSSRELQLRMYRAAGSPPPTLCVPAFALRLLAKVGDLAAMGGLRRLPLDSVMLERLAGHACYDAGRARSELGWRPLHTLNSALPEMLAALER